MPKNAAAAMTTNPTTMPIMIVFLLIPPAASSGGGSSKVSGVGCTSAKGALVGVGVGSPGVGDAIVDGTGVGDGTAVD